MRWYILRTLLLKEVLRHLADRGGIFLALLLVGASLLLSLFGKDEVKGGPFIGGVRKCYVDYWENSPWIDHLVQHPPEPRLDILFRHANQIPADERGEPIYEQSVGGIQIRPNGKDEAGRSRYKVELRHPGQDTAVLGPYVEWFWKETLHYYQMRNVPVEIETSAEQLIFPGNTAIIQVRPAVKSPSARGQHKLLYWLPQPGNPLNSELDDRLGPSSPRRLPKPVEIEVGSQELPGRADARSMVATGLVIFALCFFSVYLLPALTCEERERGVLLAQVLSPASTREILAAKFLFYPTMGMALGALLAGIYRPPVLLRPFFWLCLVTTAIGYLGVGLAISSLARTQRRASMGALCYMLSVALLIFITERFGIPSVQYFALEYYCPRIMQAALEGTVAPYHRWNLAAAIILAILWGAIATSLFRKYGWQ